MPNIKELFDKYNAHFKGAEETFKASGMINRSQELDYGFFPLGSGIFNDNSKTDVANVKENGILVLGNDFGTEEYVDTKCPNKRESASGNPTLRNLLVKLDLNPQSTFYTNFFMGLRLPKKNDEPEKEPKKKITNTQNEKKKEDDFRLVCADFFLTQLKHTQAKKVLVLGPKVAHALHLSFTSQFAAFKSKSAKISDFYKNGNKGCFINPTEGPLKDYEYMVIPHPSFSHISWKGLEIERSVKGWIG